MKFFLTLDMCELDLIPLKFFLFSFFFLILPRNGIYNGLGMVKGS